MPTVEERLALLETGYAVQNIKLDHMLENQDDLKERFAKSEKKLDDIHQMVTRAAAVGGAAWAASGGFGRLIQSAIIAAAGGLAALFGQNFVR